jgi:hypothetical protein
VLGEPRLPSCLYSPCILLYTYGSIMFSEMVLTFLAKFLVLAVTLDGWLHIGSLT